MLLKLSTLFSAEQEPVRTGQIAAETRTHPHPGEAAKASPRMAYLVSEYPGISHTFVLREVRQLRRLGFDIHVASINRPSHAPEAMTVEERDEAARTYYVKRHGLVGALAAHLNGLRRPLAWLQGLLYAFSLAGLHPRKLAYGFFYFTEALMLARWMQVRHLDHLHVHFATAAANVGLVMKRLTPVGLSLTLHGPDEFYDANGQWLSHKLAAANFVICISRFARSQAMKLTSGRHWHKFEVCPLGVDLEQFSPSRKVEESGPFTILCIGRLTPAKGQRILIDACRRLADAGRDFRLVMVGAGPDMSDLRAAASELGLGDKVIFTGALNQDQVRGWYARADAFALPSFAEGVPVVLMEAMACAIPCVTTRITGIPELIRDAQDGLLVTPSDTEELASALARLMDDPALRTALGTTGRGRVCSHYHLQRNVEQLAAIFHKRLEPAQ
jgi:glycosyltransferase involved in cell wall biosynthesis